MIIKTKIIKIQPQNRFCRAFGCGRWRKALNLDIRLNKFCTQIIKLYLICFNCGRKNGIKKLEQAQPGLSLVSSPFGLRKISFISSLLNEKYDESNCSANCQFSFIYASNWLEICTFEGMNHFTKNRASPHFLNIRHWFTIWINIVFFSYFGECPPSGEGSYKHLSSCFSVANTLCRLSNFCFTIFDRK